MIGRVAPRLGPGYTTLLSLVLKVNNLVLG
jgi:hypothetical protein